MAKACVLMLLIISIGGQWMLLQSVAWVGMMVDYSRDASICVAVQKTFDGLHPCPLCKAISAGKKSQKKSEVNLSTQKLEFPPVNKDGRLHAPARFQLFPRVALFAEPAYHKPPTPPPRGFFA